MIEPIGDICVIRDDEQKVWTVALCRGHGTRDQLATFETREEALSYATIERQRRLVEDGMMLDLHVPDDCPCGCTDVDMPLRKRIQVSVLKCEPPAHPAPRPIRR